MGGDEDVANAMARLLDESHSQVRFPLKPDDDDSVKPSTTLTYQFNATASVNLQTSWEIFKGMTLHDVTLTVVAEGAGGSGTMGHDVGVGIALQARCTIANVFFTVEGVIPDIRYDTTSSGDKRNVKNIEFILTIRAAKVNPGRVSAGELVSGLTTPAGGKEKQGGFNFDEAVGPVLTADLRGKLCGKQGSTGFVAAARLHISRGQESEYFLRRIEFGVQGQLDWQPTSQLRVTDVRLAVLVQRGAVDKEWEWNVGAEGTVAISGVPVRVSAGFTKDTTGKELVLMMEARGWQGLSAADVVKAVQPGQEDGGGQEDGAGVAEAATGGLPADAQSIGESLQAAWKQGSTDVLARIVISKDRSSGSSGRGGPGAAAPAGKGREDSNGRPLWGREDADNWGLKEVEVSVRSRDIHWAPTESLTLLGMYLAFRAQRAGAARQPAKLALNKQRPAAGDATKDGKNKWEFAGFIGCSLVLGKSGQFLLTAAVSYDSTANQLLVEAYLPDGAYGPLDEVARDFARVNNSTSRMTKEDAGAAATSPDADFSLAAEAEKNPAPTGSPLDLSGAVRDSRKGKYRGLSLVLKEKKILRATFQAWYDGTWNITDSIQLTNLGIYFDVANPQEAVKRKITGQAGGRCFLGWAVGELRSCRRVGGRT
ncbi:hypothetical protein BDZ91DRAFT_525857 [Kalaharituber pfeilii]|nr:hypothetical protein BDZ91DRAFT_525857 [Kalaharituber pfeilii]